MEEITGLVEQIRDAKLELYKRLSEYLHAMLKAYNANKREHDAVSPKNGLGLLLRVFCGGHEKVIFKDGSKTFLQLQSPLINPKDFDVLCVGVEFFD